MHHHSEQPFWLKTCASESACAHCPPDRVCAWACIQGTNCADIVTGAVLEQSHNWALDDMPEPGTPVEPALWEMFNG